MHGREGYVAQIYHSGRYCLAAGIQALRRVTNEEMVTVWIPGYFCNEALDPLRDLPVAVRFYPVREDLTPDWSLLEKWAARESGLKVFVLVHYFGFPNTTEEAHAFCYKYGMVLLEDAAHVLLPYLSIGSGDLVVFSPRKLLAVPSGGVLVISRNLAPNLVDVDGVGGREVGETVWWLARRLAQQILVRLHIPWHLFMITRWKSERSANTDGLSQAKRRRCDPFVLRLLTVMEQNMREVIKQRRRHYNCLLNSTTKLVHSRPLFPVLPDGVCPYAFPVMVDSGSKDVVARLQSWGIPASQWPDLPPEVLASEAEHRIAVRTYERLLLLPVHQSLTPKQVDVVGQRVRMALSGDP